MRLVTHSDGYSAKVGLESDGIVQETGLDPLEAVSNLADSGARGLAFKSLGRPSHRLSELSLLAPIPRPGKVIGIGMNYADHCREQGIDQPTKPVVFAKFTTSIIGPNAAIWWPAMVTRQVDWEVELAVVIGVGACVAGYTIANDITARDLRVADGQFVRCKSLDSFCPMGPALVTAEGIGDAGRLNIWLDRNGKREQTSNTSNLIFGVAALIRFCGDCFTLEPGDVILTGTPPGVGTFRKPPEYLAAGDIVEAGIEKIGVLRNPVEGARH